MKKRVLIFLCAALLALTIVPLINLTLGNGRLQLGEKWWSRAALYNFDFAMPYLNRFFYGFGISTAPQQVVIGQHDWLYVGDKYRKAITVKRHGAMREDAEAAKKIGLATNAWEQWLKHKGVSLYRIILSPDKGTIYPEFLPDWAQPAAESATDVLLAQVSHTLYIDTRPALKLAKSQFAAPLYYKTDTHWNSLGAWIAYRALAQQLAQTEHGLRCLTEEQVHISKASTRQGGDLANFLWMKQILPDSEVPIEISTEFPIETERYDFETGQLTGSGGNPQIDVQWRPLLVKSKHALNQKRVLWLGDSFGLAMSPFMAATFSETLQLHYSATDPALIAQLVDTFKPDYVFISVVERAALIEWFAKPPPLIFATAKQKNFVSLSRATQSGIHDIIPMEGTENYRIAGVDPFVTFALSNPIRTSEASRIVFDLTCGEMTETVKVQLFWHTAGAKFTETNSAHFATRPGIIAIDLAPLAAWTQAGVITDLRFDFVSPKTCPVLTLNDVELGQP